jgi:hypothetical protein
MAEGCCPKCGSRLYSDDERYMKHSGVCSGCVSWDKTPDKRFQKAYDEGVTKEAAESARKYLQRNTFRGKKWWAD